MRVSRAASGRIVTSFVVSGSEGLLTTMVASLVQQHVDYDVRVENASYPAVVDGVRVTEVAEGRWLFVAPVHGGHGSAVEALSAGATAVLHLGSSPSEFDQALRVVISGERPFVPVDIVRWMAGEALAQRSGARSVVNVSLTQREGEILHLVGRGLSNQEIADELSISTNTVRSHMHALSVKLDATSRTKILANARALAIPEALEFRQSEPHTGLASA